MWHGFLTCISMWNPHRIWPLWTCPLSTILYTIRRVMGTFICSCNHWEFIIKFSVKLVRMEMNTDKITGLNCSSDWARTWGSSATWEITSANAWEERGLWLSIIKLDGNNARDRSALRWLNLLDDVWPFNKPNPNVSEQQVWGNGMGYLGFH